MKDSLSVRRKSLLHDYSVPSFAKVCDGIVPSKRLMLARLPTPIEPLPLPEMPQDVALDVKRDDQTGGIELMGNKVRKLEFLLSEALQNDSDVVFTAGGTQSNHARATVAACAKLSMPVQVFLRKDESDYNGNFFLNRLLGATVHEFSQEEWKSLPASSPDWLEDRANVLRSQGTRVTVIPVGGSNAIGTWGYIEQVNELAQQFALNGSYQSVVACSGSGGTLSGLGLGVHLYSLANVTCKVPKVVSYSVCDTPDWFYEKVNKVTKQIFSTCPDARALVSVRDARGEGYAKSTTEELQFIARVARETGVVFDTCYTGKTVFGMWKEMKQGSYSGQKVLFVHTGGGPSLFDKVDRFHSAI